MVDHDPSHDALQLSALLPTRGVVRLAPVVRVDRQAGDRHAGDRRIGRSLDPHNVHRVIRGRAAGRGAILEQHGRPGALDMEVTCVKTNRVGNQVRLLRGREDNRSAAGRNSRLDRTPDRR